jgi:hypothetical protein
MPELVYKNRLPSPKEFEHDLDEAMKATAESEFQLIDVSL